MHRLSPVLVVGVDTGVGKTLVTCAIARALGARGHSVLAVKPVETGCDGTHPEDGALLASATGQAQPTRALRRFATPLAAAVAADLEGAPLQLDTLVSELNALQNGTEIVLIEGAGGLLSPVSWTWTLVDLARALQAHVLLVASDRLGCLNHALLTLESLDRSGLSVCGAIFSQPERGDRSTGSNPASLERLVPHLPICVIPWLPHDEYAHFRLDAVVPWLIP